MTLGFTISILPMYPISPAFKSLIILWIEPGIQVGLRGSRIAPVLLTLHADDQVVQQDLYAECGARAEETCHKSEPCWQVVTLVGTENKFVNDSECLGKKWSLRDSHGEHRDSRRYGHIGVLCDI